MHFTKHAAWQSAHSLTKGLGDKDITDEEKEEKEEKDVKKAEKDDNDEKDEEKEEGDDEEKDVKEDKEDDETDKKETETKKDKEKEVKEDEEDDEKDEEEDQVPEIDKEPMPETTPPPGPDWNLFEHADEVARDVELRRGAEFFPEGTVPGVDVTAQEENEVQDIFNMDPNAVFGNCMLIRDYAEPLRVGNAIIRTRSSLRGQSLHQRSLLRASGRSYSNSSKPNDEGGKGDDNKIPDEMLIPKGAVVDRDQETPDDKGEPEAEMQVNMVAFLRSIAGEVAVVPNGLISKWTSKRKVPIAGYLCSDKDGWVLHTLPTPCLPTALDDEGMPIPPPPITPPPMPAMEPEEEADDKQGGAEDDKAEEQAEEEAEQEAAEEEVDKVADEDPDAAAPAASFFQTGSRSSESKQKSRDTLKGTAMGVKRTHRAGPAPSPAASPAASPSSSPAAPPGPAAAAAPQNPKKARIFPVFVGNTRLTFSSKPKAERFCTRLAHKIAREMGDYEWDGAEEKAMQDAASKVNVVNPTVSSFVQLARRKTDASWTV